MFFLQLAERNAKVSPEDSDSIEKLEAVIYTMAEKFLEKVDIEDVRNKIPVYEK